METLISIARGSRNVAPSATLRYFALLRNKSAGQQTVEQLLSALEVTEATL